MLQHVASHLTFYVAALGIGVMMLVALIVYTSKR